jgi:hypothetical protein
MKYLRGNDILPPGLIEMVQVALENYDPDFSGATVYIPSRQGSNIRSKPSDERIQARALAIVAIHDGFTRQEAASMAGVSTTTVATWMQRFGPAVFEAIKEIRGEHHVG